MLGKSICLPFWATIALLVAEAQAQSYAGTWDDAGGAGPAWAQSALDEAMVLVGHSNVMTSDSVGDTNLAMSPVDPNTGIPILGGIVKIDVVFVMDVAGISDISDSDQLVMILLHILKHELFHNLELNSDPGCLHFERLRDDLHDLCDLIHLMCGVPEAIDKVCDFYKIAANAHSASIQKHCQPGTSLVSPCGCCD